MNWRMKSDIQITSIEIWKKSQFLFYYIFVEKNLLLYLLYIGFGIIGIGRYEKFHIGILSVSADKKIEFIGLYRYRLIWKKAYRSYTDESTYSYMNMRMMVVSDTQGCPLPGHADWKRDFETSMQRISEFV